VAATSQDFRPTNHDATDFNYDEFATFRGLEFERFRILSPAPTACPAPDAEVAGSRETIFSSAPTGRQAPAEGNALGLRPPPTSASPEGAIPSPAPMSKRKTASPASNTYRGLLDDLSAIIAPLHALHRQGVEAHAPSVREILRCRSRDAHLIERTLDHLLDHACIPQGLALFKSLCRHYWEINPQATASYINVYREMWDSDERETHETEHLANDQEAKLRDAKSPASSPAPKGRHIPAQRNALGQCPAPTSASPKGAPHSRRP